MPSTTTHNPTREGPSVLASLRSLAPARPLTLPEALRVAELQATRLLAVSGVRETPVPSDIVCNLPRISVEYDFDMPDSASGTSAWDNPGRSWVVKVNAHQPDTRQRFTMLHEYKHILDYGHPGLVADRRQRYYGLTPVEFIADYFAGCVLMPKLLVKRAWARGIKKARDLALLFDVSERAMQVRLAQLGLVEPRVRCLPPAPARQRRAQPTRHATNNRREISA